jgi:hypothetical protein
MNVQKGLATEKESAERTSLKALIELVDEDFAERWHLLRSRRFCLFSFVYCCVVLGVPLVLMFEAFLSLWRTDSLASP